MHPCLPNFEYPNRIFKPPHLHSVVKGYRVHALQPTFVSRHNVMTFGIGSVAGNSQASTRSLTKISIKGERNALTIEDKVGNLKNGVV